eukprot:CAMPEP_0170454986 /NCGR_PEP_ID=MMETSP0123-20130129/3068_1 /TAXON_ID=182087 /ORGANISM="Favella ehrenbergii, Strain Fehren 1" /LENGTH=70 /DNA_ID=CAMNT_0010717907 /DNA_START=730 /DNA_END=942 /DNA_ORIENTATION=-
MDHCADADSEETTIENASANQNQRQEDGSSCPKRDKYGLRHAHRDRVETDRLRLQLEVNADRDNPESLEG